MGLIGYLSKVGTALHDDALTANKIADNAFSEEHFDANALQAVRFGKKVSRATAALPQSGPLPLFTIAGGRVVINAIIGQVTTIIEASANAAKLISNPTTGTDVDLCATLDINAKEAGTLLGITGIFADAMVGPAAGGTVVCQRGVVLPVGTIDLNCAASKTGNIKWDVYYTPLDSGATVAAVAIP